MAHFKIYIMPFNDDGDYDSDFIDVTDYVDRESFSSIAQHLDNSEYNVGVFSFDNFSIGLQNTDGLFSDVGIETSIFKYSRADSVVKITYAVDEDFIAGVSIAGVGHLSDEVEVFRGLLNDESAAARMDAQTLSFQVLGLESILARSLVPSIAALPGISARDALQFCLSETDIADLVFISSDNITVGTDFTIDSIEDIETKTVKDLFDDLLLLSNSVFYIRNGVAYITPRTAGAYIAKIFHGQSSQLGVEDVVGITDIRSGINKCFNFWSWKDSGIYVSDPDSIALNKVRKKKEFDYPFVTNTTSQSMILSSLLTEFKDPKTELLLSTPLTYETLNLGFLDKVAVDYPAISYSAEGDLAVYGISKYGQAFYPITLNTLVLSADQEFKVMGRRIDTKSFNIEFKLRRV